MKNNKPLRGIRRQKPIESEPINVPAPINQPPVIVITPPPPRRGLS